MSALCVAAHQPDRRACVRGRSLDLGEMQVAAGELHGELGRMEEAVAARRWLAVKRLSAADLQSIRSSKRCCAPPTRDVRPMALGFLPLAERYPALEHWRQRVTTQPGYMRTYLPHWRETT